MSSHSSEIRDLCLMKWSCEMLQSQNLSNIQKPIVCLFSFHTITLFFTYEIALVYLEAFWWVLFHQT